MATMRTMNENWVKYLDVNAPRYTSFPSALFFDNRVNSDVYGDALSKIGTYEPVSLYIHVPFCKQLCWYCGCNLIVENKYERAAKYVDCLIKEIEAVADRLGGKGEIVNIHFGGGTPNFLSIEDLARLMDAIELNLGLTDKTHIAMEVDPRVCSVEQIDAFIKLGIDRFSIGVQDFDDDVQRAINRVQPFEMVEEKVAAMREHSIADISFDLLYGLPKQSMDTFHDTLEKTIALSPDRISLFGYAHLPSKLRHQRLIKTSDLPDKLRRYDLADMAEQFLVRNGYVSIGFDHFAKPDNPLALAAASGKLRRNFQGFTDDVAETLIGLGVSAVSSVKGVYAQNAKRLDAYQENILAGNLPIEKGWIRTLEDEMWGRVISDLLCFRRASLHNHLQSNVKSAEHILTEVRQRLTPLVRDGLAEWDDGDIIVPKQARHFARVVAATFDPYLSSEQISLSQVV